MHQIYSAIQAIDFGLERYQTLIVGAAAVAAAIWAVRPAWRQVSIMEAQLTGQIRERLAARYRMIEQALKLLDPEAWRRRYPRLSPEEQPDEAYQEQLKASYEDRKQHWARIRADLERILAPDQLALLAADFMHVEGRFGECDDRFAGKDPYGQFSAGPASDLAYYTSDYPDMMVIARMTEARRVLEAQQGELVAQLVTPTHP